MAAGEIESEMERRRRKKFDEIFKFWLKYLFLSFAKTSNTHSFLIGHTLSNYNMKKRSLMTLKMIPSVDDVALKYLQRHSTSWRWHSEIVDPKKKNYHSHVVG